MNKIFDNEDLNNEFKEFFMENFTNTCDINEIYNIIYEVIVAQRALKVKN